MARPTQQDIARELDLLVRILAAHPEGVSRPAAERELGAALGRRMSLRTAFRRLQELVAQGRARTEGRGRALVYKAVGAEPRVAEPGTDAEVIPISTEGGQITAFVRRPISARPPVGYDPAFLQQYRPNRTWYLSEAERAGLHALGRTPDAERPAGTYAREIFGRLLIDLAWASSRLEGNTYSRLDTQNLIEFGQRAEGKDVTEAQMIINHKAAIELLVDGAEDARFDRYTVSSLHAALSENLLSNPRDEGRLRETPVLISGTPFVPLAIPQKIEEYFDLMLDTAARIHDPFEQSFFMMVHLPYLQPFIDVNKRTSRLAANIPLIKSNLCPLSFVDVPINVYVEGLLGVYELRRVELLRDVFLWAYARSCAQYRVVRDSIGQPDPFRLRYRNQLAEVVRETVLAGEPPRREALRTWAEQHDVTTSDLDTFADKALELLLGLHEHSAARYRLRPAEYSQWRARFPGAAG